MLAAARAELLYFNAIRIVAAILLCRVIALFTIGTRQRDHRTNIF